MGSHRKPNRPKGWLKRPSGLKPSGTLRAVAPKVSVVGAAKVAFEELAQAFIAHNIPSQVAERILRAAYVRETVKQVGKGWGEEPNVSHISIKTGLDRHLIKAILDNKSEALPLPEGRRDPLTRVADGWATDPEYSTAQGPRDLAVTGKRPSQRSAYALVERYARGVSAALVVQELLDAGRAAVLPNGKLRLSGAKALPHTAPNTQRGTYGVLRLALKKVLFPRLSAKGAQRRP
jgi:hypothetical protein